MKKDKAILSWPLGGKTILWLAGPNKYILAEAPAAMVIQRIGNRESIRSIIRFFADEFNLSSEKAEAFVNDVRQCLAGLQTCALPGTLWLNRALPKINTAVFTSKKYYRIYESSFFVEYETEEMELLIHPKFEYLEVQIMPNPDHHFQVMNTAKECSLRVDGELIGTWDLSNSHFLSGKFSMQMLQKIYKREEDDWMAVFHAAGITNGKNCLMFLGDSGNGKSTLSVILMARGLEVLSDDFLPIESRSALVCHFPAAISVKTNAYELLIPQFPHLMKSREINNISACKTFRHLPAQRFKPLRVPCKALVFIKYEKGSGICLEEMPGEEAFKRLVPDSWISSTSENADRFVSWFTSLPYYRMTYSDNEKMVKTVKEILNDDL